MNWAVLSVFGYVSLALWLCMPLLWLLHVWRGSRGWLPHAAVVCGVAAMVMATLHTRTYVDRVRVDQGEQSRMSAQERARMEAERQRAEQVADVRFAEDASGDFLDKAGLDDADMKYFESFNDEQAPDWKKQQRQRTTDNDTSDLEAMIGGGEEREGLESEAAPEQQQTEPILLPDREARAVYRINSANHTAIQVMLAVAILIVPLDYLRRLNRREAAYLPLPVPSRWADAMTPREPVQQREVSRPMLVKELHDIARRGEVFLYLTDDQDSADRVPDRLPRLPVGLWPIEVLRVNSDEQLSDEFVFETLWFGRDCFVIDSAERAERMARFLVEQLSERVRTRAHTRQTVHVIWDMPGPLPQELQQRFVKLGRATGCLLHVCSRSE